MSLVDLADVMLYTKAPAEDNAFMALLQQGVEEAFKGLVGWRIEAQTGITEYYSGYWTERIALRQIPVNSITSVNVDNQGYWGQNQPGVKSFLPATALVAGQDYALKMDGDGGVSKSGELIRLTSVWPGLIMSRRGDLSNQRVEGQGNIQVVYSCGYDPIPNDIKQAIYEACKELRISRFAAGRIGSEGLAEYSYSILNITPYDLLRIGTMQQIVMRYRRLRLQ